MSCCFPVLISCISSFPVTHHVHINLKVHPHNFFTMMPFNYQFCKKCSPSNSVVNSIKFSTSVVFELPKTLSTAQLQSCRGKQSIHYALLKEIIAKFIGNFLSLFPYSRTFSRPHRAWSVVASQPENQRNPSFFSRQSLESYRQY